MNYKAIARVSSWIQHSASKLTVSQLEYALFSKDSPASWLLRLVPGSDSCPSKPSQSIPLPQRHLAVPKLCWFSARLYQRITALLSDVTAPEEVLFFSSQHFIACLRSRLFNLSLAATHFYSVRKALLLKAIINVEVWLRNNTHYKMLFMHYVTVSYL